MRVIVLIIFGLVFHSGLKAQWLSYQAPDTINIDLNKIQNDTLMLSGYIAECGEFGGYIDEIKIFKSNHKLYALLIKGQSCKTKLRLPDGLNPYNNIVLLDSKKLKCINNYINSFGVLAITNTAFSNAPTEFWIQYENKKYHRWDPTGRWSEFIKLRDEIFEK